MRMRLGDPTALGMAIIGDVRDPLPPTSERWLEPSFGEDVVVSQFTDAQGLRGLSMDSKHP